MANDYVCKWFKPEEFRCKCGCGLSAVGVSLLMVLDDVREHFGKPVLVVSGCRCKKHNAAVGGAKASKHMLGIAADIKVRGVEPIEVWGYLTEKYPNKFGIGLYKTWVHIDTRSSKARWDET